jgi:hypothetical protein
MKLISFVLVLSAIAIGISANAAPMCRSVLRAPPNQQQINIALDDLARLTLDTDLAKSNGGERKSLLENVLRIKSSEVMTSLGLNKEGLREALRARIARLQKLEELDNGPKIEQQKRQEESRFSHPYFELRQELVDLSALGGYSDVSYLPERNSLILVKDEVVQLFNLETQELKVIVPDAKFLQVSHDGKFFYVFKNNNMLETYSAHDNSLVKSVPTNLAAKEVGGFTINEGATKAAVNLTASTVLIDLSTAEKIHTFDVRAIESAFVGDNEFFWLQGAGQVSKMDLTSKAIISSQATAYSDKFLVTIDNVVLPTRSGKMYFLDRKTLQITGQIDNFFGSGLAEISNTPGQYVAITDRYGESGIYNNSNPNMALFNFENRYLDSGKAVRKTMSSDDGNTLIILHYTRDLNRYGVDIWKRTSVD